MSYGAKNLVTQIAIGEDASDGSFSRTEGENPSVSVRFVITGADDASTAYIALLSWLHSNYNDGAGGIAAYDLPLADVKIESTGSALAYRATCDFAYPTLDNKYRDINSQGYQLPDVEDSDYSFSTTGHTSHLTHSYETLSYVPSGQTARDFAHGIGYNGDTFDGVDVVSPTVQFSISVSLPQKWFDSRYRIKIAEATGSVNSQPFDGYGAGCVLFKGVSARPVWFDYSDPYGNQSRDWYWRATYNFEASQAATLTYEGQTIYKRGYDYIWRYTEKVEDADSGQLNSTVSQVNLERVYPEFDFDLLGLPIPARSDVDPSGSGSGSGSASGSASGSGSGSGVIL